MDSTGVRVLLEASELRRARRARARGDPAGRRRRAADDRGDRHRARCCRWWRSRRDAEHSASFEPGDRDARAWRATSWSAGCRPRSPSSDRGALRLLVSELVTNSVRHAAASHVAGRPGRPHRDRDDPRRGARRRHGLRARDADAARRRRRRRLRRLRAVPRRADGEPLGRRARRRHAGLVRARPRARRALSGARPRQPRVAARQRCSPRPCSWSSTSPSDGTFARSLYLLPVLAIAIRAPARDVAVAGVRRHGARLRQPDLERHARRGLAAAAGHDRLGLGDRGVGRARARMAEQARARPPRPSAPSCVLLADAARITDGAAHIDEALRRLVDLLVPAVADAAWVDVLGPGGDVRRIAARVDGEAAEVLEAWLMQRGAGSRAELSPTTRALRGEGSQLAELTPRPARGDEPRRRRPPPDAALAPALDDGDPARPERRAARRARPGRRPRPGAGTGEDDLAFASLLVGRAGLALANAQLVDRLTATQRRLDGILGSLAEAVTVQDVARPHGVREPGGRRPARAARTSPPCSPPTPPSSPSASRSATRTAVRSRSRSCPGYGVLRGEQPEPLLTQSIYRATGEVHWFLTKATGAGGRDRRAARRQRDRGRHGGARGGAARALPRRGRPGVRLLARLRGHAAARGAARRPRPRRLVRDRAARRARPARSRSRSRTSIPTTSSSGRALRDALPARPRRADGHARGDAQRREPQLLPDIPDALLVEAAQDAEQLEGIRALGLRSAMVVPMITGGRTLGTMTFVYAESGRRYTRTRRRVRAGAGRPRRDRARELAPLHRAGRRGRHAAGEPAARAAAGGAGLELRRRLPPGAARRRGRRRLLRRVRGRGRPRGAARRRDRARA